VIATALRSRRDHVCPDGTPRLERDANSPGEKIDEQLVSSPPTPRFYRIRTSTKGQRAADPTGLEDPLVAFEGPP
jgi:hypothetical protein